MITILHEWVQWYIYLLDSLISIDSKVRALMDIQTKELESAHSQKKKTERVSPYKVFRYKLFTAVVSMTLFTSPLELCSYLSFGRIWLNLRVNIIAKGIHVLVRISSRRSEIKTLKAWRFHQCRWTIFDDNTLQFLVLALNWLNMRETCCYNKCKIIEKMNIPFCRTVTEILHQVF